MGMAADITMDRYYEGNDVLVRDSDTTTQLWVRHDAFISTYAAVLFSDSDLDYGGGVAVYISNNGTPKIGAETCTDCTPTAINLIQYGETPFPNDHAWHFVRAVHANGMVQLCLDGKAMASYPLAAGKMQSTRKPYIAKNVVWTPSSAYFDGGIDDVRVFAGALPCEQP
jgi:hypothetical protein